MLYGSRGSGKNHILSSITNHMQPSSGEVLFCPHQTALQVIYQPLIVERLGLLDNLRFGSQSKPDIGHAQRVKAIFKALGKFPDEHWLMKKIDDEILQEPREKDRGTNASDPRWYLRLSHSETKMIHLA